MAELADMTMAPSADMFELGVKVQVLKRGTMFASRAATLYNLYTRFPSLDAIPADELARIEQQLFRQPVGEVWEDARKFFEVRGPHENERAARDPKHKMALVFRSYLGRSSRWPIDGDVSRRLDYQIWCGPAMGAFNAWVKGSFLEKPENRTLSRSRAICSRVQPMSPGPPNCAVMVRRFPPQPSSLALSLIHI